MFRIIVLGAAAGGGVPQWNCACDTCRRAYAGGLAPMTQSSLAVTGDGEHWFLLNATPDLRQQILQTPALHPRDEAGRRHSPIAGVVVTNADVDHVAGLLTLRESHPLRLYGTRRVRSVLAGNSIFAVLNPDFVHRETLPLNERIDLRLPDGRPTGLSVEAFAVPGKVALWLEDPEAEGFGSVAEDTVALEVTAADGRRFFHIPGCAAMTPELADRLSGAPLVFFDGTTFTDDEMIAHGLGVKTASRMGHMPMSGQDGSLRAFADLGVRRKVFIHVNNSNPALLPDSAERRAVLDAGWEIAQDGLEVEP